MQQYDFKARAAEKQAARERDQRQLDSGEKSAEQLQRENGLFSFAQAKVELKAVVR